MLSPISTHFPRITPRTACATSAATAKEAIENREDKKTAKDEKTRALDEWKS